MARESRKNKVRRRLRGSVVSIGYSRDLQQIELKHELQAQVMILSVNFSHAFERKIKNQSLNPF